jgi:hypothetical protein
MFPPTSFLGVLKRRIPHILVLAVLFAAMDSMRAFPMLVDARWEGLAAVGNVFVQALFYCALVVAAITAAERSAFAQAHRGLALGAAVLIAAPIATAMGEQIVWLLHLSPVSIEGDRLSLYLYVLWYALLVGFLAAAYFTIWERAVLTTTKLRAAEIEHQDVQRRLVESRLKVMKARVDPGFLFRRIRDIQRQYSANSEAAEQRLDDLIDYLRAALPPMHGGATTLGEEVHLAATYVRLHEAEFDGRLSCAFGIDEAFESTRFPPMALLPLIDDALRRALAAPHPQVTLRIAALESDELLRVTVEDNCYRVRPDTAGHSGLVEHERTFLEFFGTGARIERTVAAGAGTRVLLEIEHAVATSADR